MGRARRGGDRAHRALYLTVSQWLAVALVVAASVGATVTTPRVAVHAEV